MASNREKFAIQVDAKTLAAVRRIAKKEGRQLQSVIEEALRMEPENLDLWHNKAVTLRHLWRIREMVQVAAHVVDMRRAACTAAS